MYVLKIKDLPLLQSNRWEKMSSGFSWFLDPYYGCTEPVWHRSRGRHVTINLIPFHHLWSILPVNCQLKYHNLRLSRLDRHPVLLFFAAELLVSTHQLYIPSVVITVIIHKITSMRIKNSILNCDFQQCDMRSNQTLPSFMTVASMGYGKKTTILLIGLFHLPIIYFTQVSLLLLFPQPSSFSPFSNPLNALFLIDLSAPYSKKLIQTIFSRFFHFCLQIQCFKALNPKD